MSEKTAFSSKWLGGYAGPSTMVWMPSSLPRLLLLPGMDGTGELFGALIRALPPGFKTEVVEYPRDRVLSYVELIDFVNAKTPSTEPYVLLGESFSSPIAIACAARGGPNLKGLILCAGFVRSPVRSWLRWTIGFSRVVFLLPLQDIASKWFLLGESPSSSLLSAVRGAVSSVKPEVLADRLQSVASCDMQAEFNRIRVPILYVQALQDRLIGLSALDKIQGLRPDILISIVDGPHLVLQKEPSRSAEVISAFVHHLK